MIIKLMENYINFIYKINMVFKYNLIYNYSNLIFMVIFHNYIWVHLFILLYKWILDKFIQKMLQ